MATKERATGGKKPGQKYKSLLVWQILQKETDEEHPITVQRIQEYLEAYGIVTDVRSIYRDIHDLQELFEKDENADEDEIEDRERLGYVLDYTRKPLNGTSGYMVTQRPYSFDDLRLLAECINSTRFISDRKARDLREVLGNFCSVYEEERLVDEVYNVDRPKTPNKYVVNNVSTINQAIKENKKISFLYNKYTLENRTSQTPRRKGVTYSVSPFQVMITEGNYYAFCYDARMHRIIPYRIDRMTKVNLLDEAREGGEAFNAIDIKTFPQRVFGMFQGREYMVTMKFNNRLLDTVVERLGAGGKGSRVSYSACGDKEFTVTAPIEISEQFFGWFSGIGKKGKIMGPEPVVEEYKKFIADIASNYEE